MQASDGLLLERMESQASNGNKKKNIKKEEKKGTKQVLVTLSDSPLLQEHKVIWSLYDD